MSDDQTGAIIRIKNIFNAPLTPENIVDSIAAAFHVAAGKIHGGGPEAACYGQKEPPAHYIVMTDHATAKTMQQNRPDAIVKITLTGPPA